MKSTYYSAVACGAAVLFALTVGGAAHAQTTTTFTLSGTSATAGAVTIRSDQATTNQSTGGQQDQMIVGQNAATGILHGLMEFSLSGIAPSPGQSIQVTSASVTLTSYTSNRGTDSTGGNFTVSLLNYGYNLDATTATWNSPAPGDSTHGGSETGMLLTSASGSNTTVTWNFGSTPDLTAAIANALNSGDGSLRLLAYVPAYEGNTTVQDFERFFSSYSGNSASVQPQLSVTYTYVASGSAPEPTSVALLAGTALPAAFAFIRRRAA